MAQRVGPCAAPQEQGLGEACRLSHPQWFCVPPTWRLEFNPISTRLTQKGTSGHFPLTDTRTSTHTLSASRRLWAGALDVEFCMCSAGRSTAPMPVLAHMQQDQRRLLRGLGFINSWKTGPISKGHNSQQSTPAWSREGSHEPGKSQGCSEMWVPAYPLQLMGLPLQPASW